MYEYHPYTGLAIRESEYLVVADGTRTVRRTWGERLFSRPWRPFKATKEETVYRPDDSIYRVGQMLVCHPVTARKLKAALEKRVRC